MLHLPVGRGPPCGSPPPQPLPGIPHPGPRSRLGLRQEKEPGDLRAPTFTGSDYLRSVASMRVGFWGLREQGPSRPLCIFPLPGQHPVQDLPVPPRPSVASARPSTQSRGVGGGAPGQHPLWTSALDVDLVSSRALAELPRLRG